MPSAPSYIQFLAGPGAAPHWKSGRAVTPDLDKADAARMHHGTAIGPSSVKTCFACPLYMAVTFDSGETHASRTALTLKPSCGAYLAPSVLAV
jgi:hypothetical protein